MKRRDFIKTTAGGVAAITLSSKIPGFTTPAYAASPINRIRINITDAIKEFHCFNGVPEQQDPNSTCYFWAYQMSVEFADALGNFVPVPLNVPGPTIFATVGDVIRITVTNNLTQPHAFVIPGMVNTGAIPPGGTRNRTFTATTAGSFLYFDNLNNPVNRVMGLHGAFVVMPAAPSGAKWTPYAAGQATAQVQRLFNNLGSASWWPGLAWEGERADTLTPPFRQAVWICHQASPNLFALVGDTPGDFPSAEFVRRFRRDAFNRDGFNFNINGSGIPNHFTITGQQGHFCHNNPIITPMARVGEPYVVRVMNAGLMTHSMHLHANHFYVLAVDGIVQGDPSPADPSLQGPGPIWIDTMTLNPFGERSSKYDMLIPYMRPPDVPNRRGIGRGGAPDVALRSDAGPRVWPPFEEFDLFHPVGGTAQGQDPADPTGQTLITVPLAQRQSPLCYPMHDHSEPTQSTQGGNYNTALISGMYFIGDLNVALPQFNINDDPAMPLLPPQTFPMDEDFAMMLGLDQDPQILAYGIDEARRRGIMEASKQSDLEAIRDRPPFPPGFNDPAFP